jgi:hypothetical protein
MTISKLLQQATIYLDKEYIKVGYNEEFKILFNIWNGFSSFEEVLEVGNRTLEIADKKSAKKVLFDSTNMEILDKESRDYISNQFTTKMTGLGVKYAATVLPEDVFAQNTIKDIQVRLQQSQNVHVKYFNDCKKALDWLQSKA